VTVDDASPSPSPPLLWENPGVTRIETVSAHRRSLGAAIVAAAVGLAGCGGPASQPDEAANARPPIIVIVIDTLRADYLGAFGFDGPISPNLDALAEESVLFERCSSQAPWTTPSMAAMMTSLYPEAHGVRLAPDDPRRLQDWRRRWTPAIPESTTTLAESLHDRGYRTAAFVANPWLVKGLGFEQGFDTFDANAAERLDRDASTVLQSGRVWLDPVTSEDDPTFLYLHLMDVHGPYTAPESDFTEVRSSAGLGPARIVPDSGFRHIEKYLLKPPWTRQQDRRELRVWRGRYAAGVHAVDRRLGVFIQALRDEGIWDRQLVVVTSDHGEELFDNGGWDHGFNLHDHQLHVPLMIRFPRSKHGGSRVAGSVRLVDLMPTLIGLAGADEPPGMTGLDLRPLVVGGAGRAADRPAFATSVKHRPGATAYFDGRYKLMSDLAERRLRLYDLAADPGEHHDLADEQPEIVRRLGRLLGAEIAKVEPGEPRVDRAGDIPEEQADRLRELGYLE